MLRIAPALIVFLLCGPIAVGVLMALLPAFGYMPAFGRDEFSLDIWIELSRAPGILQSACLSLLVGVITPFVSLLLVLLFLGSAAGTRLDLWTRSLVAPLLAIPHAAAAFGLAFLIAPSGFIVRLISPELSGWQRPPDLVTVNDPMGLALIAGLIVKEVPFLLLMSLAALPQLNPGQRVMMARTLGYPRTIAWLKTVAPDLYQLIRLPVFAVIVFACSTVDVAIILGPNLPPTLSVRVLEWFSSPDISDRFLASSGAILQLMLCLIVVFIWLCMELIFIRLWRLWLNRGVSQFGETILYWLGISGVTVSVAVIAASVLALIINGFSAVWRFPNNLPMDWTLLHWQRAINNFSEPLVNTLIISCLATLIALLLVIAALEWEQRCGRENRTISWFLYLPLVIPQIAFLFGIVVASEFMQWTPNIALVLAGHLLFVLPYVFLSLAETYRRLDPRWGQLAAALGASQDRTFWRIRLPMLFSAVLTSAAIGFAISIAQYLPTALLGAGRVPTITTEAVALASGGARSTIAVWAQIQALLPIVGFALALILPRMLWRRRLGMSEVA